MPLLATVKIPRAVAKGTSHSKRTLHSFADASELAYAAVLYLKSEEAQGEVEVTLLTSKSKVALIKQVTLSRLELCAATLLTRLVKHSAETLGLNSLPTYLWTDSMVTLGWIQEYPSR